MRLRERVARLEATIGTSGAAPPEVVFIMIQAEGQQSECEPERWTCGAWCCDRLPGEGVDDFAQRTLHEYRAAHADAVAVPIFTSGTNTT